MVWLFQRLHSNTSSSTGAPAQGGSQQLSSPVPLRKELQGRCSLSCLQSWCHSCSGQALLDPGSTFAGCILYI